MQSTASNGSPNAVLYVGTFSTPEQLLVHQQLLQLKDVEVWNLHNPEFRDAKGPVIVGAGPLINLAQNLLHKLSLRRPAAVVFWDCAEEAQLVFSARNSRPEIHPLPLFYVAQTSVLFREERAPPQRRKPLALLRKAHFEKQCLLASQAAFCFAGSDWLVPRYYHDETKAKLQQVANVEELSSQVTKQLAINLRPQASTIEASPRFEICVAHYNHGKFLPALLESLENQTASNFSVTLVDDGSTDSYSQEVFAKMSQKFASREWKFLKQKNSGPSQARNFAARSSEASYLIFMDSDNLAHPTMIAQYNQALRLSDLECYVSWFAYFESLESTGLPAITHYFAPLGDCLETGFFENTFGDTNFCIRRSTFLELGAFPKDLEDWVFLLRAAVAQKSLGVIPEALFYYRVMPSSRGKSFAQNSFTALAREIAHIPSAKLRTLFEFGLFPLAQRERDLEFRKEWQENRHQKYFHLKKLVRSLSVDQFLKRLSSSQ